MSVLNNLPSVLLYIFPILPYSQNLLVKYDSLNRGLKMPLSVKICMNVFLVKSFVRDLLKELQILLLIMLHLFIGSRYMIQYLTMLYELILNHYSLPALGYREMFVCAEI